jgi:hypothetical protein
MYLWNVGLLQWHYTALYPRNNSGQDDVAHVENGKSNFYCVSFQVLTAASMKFWDVAPCSHFEVDRRFRGAMTALVMEAVRYIPEDS